ncbi:histidinol-phosphate transaminase [Gluconobacter kanchanaburiensis]|uniref:Histidinol-phosphate aminotransferase n=1 Tax=Gluconobacter kanchanaburiensis NBRC 103587 TaxID=1307948 RepID=A0A511B775_9PROT|nr:histidinol-phosphate transaminase [Gluconobacter kanchanaburiensis]MBF0862269.1 histidinol-phosphate transaminase [Gluconobacter kanchanaburiensis]GBR68960.1 histidinol-phosphate aminotransferase [Gluconobacter kanchanaburiensis NBRC 103587]GEK96259.1 histidinol-phosphate aminotransferase [Gluconobacter kanchanaburiensis NBRC 103587]
MTAVFDCRTSPLALARTEIRQLPVYNAGLSEDAVRDKYGVQHITKLGSNENPYGPSPAALSHWNDISFSLFRYPDASAEALREELSRQSGIDTDRILVGNGSEQIIRMICEAFLSPDDRLVTVLPSFGLHLIWPEMMGARADAIPMTADARFDMPALLAAVKSGPLKVLMFSNPSNPVGCIMTDSAMRDLIDACPTDTLIVIDEAYWEYAQSSPEYADSLTILKKQPRPWMVLRTFSKAYGLAALRVGYALTSGADLTSVMTRVRDPFNSNSAALEMARLSLLDQDHMRTSVEATLSEGRTLKTALENRDYFVAPSFANFLFFDAREPAAALAERLLEHGVIVKPWKENGYESWIRVSVARPEDSRIFLRALDDVRQP